MAGLPEEACTAAEEGLALLPEYGLELPVGAALACNAANMLIRRGRYERCAAVLAELLDGRVVRGQGLHLHVERAELQLVLGDTAGARASLAAAAELADADEPAVVAALASATAELLEEEGDRDGCYRTVDEALRRLADTQDVHFRTLLVGIGLRSEADRFDGVPGRRTPESERQIERLAAELAGLESPPDEDVNGAADHLTARNELARAQGRGEDADWPAAAALWRAALRPREEAYCLLREAECHVAAKDRTRAARAATSAREIAERLGVAPLVEQIDALLARTRLRPPPPRQPVEERAFGLTDRELEVLRLLGTGATNRQIARSLFISERTVGVHVSRILHKLHVANRGQAAAIAVRLVP